jgi:DNA-binding PadR family transcriptional regulator
MSTDRHINSNRNFGSRKEPPTTEEIFGDRKRISEMELGMLQMQVLWLLNRKPTHGYEIMDTLNKIKRTKITQGTLYPTLQRLESLKLIKGEKEDRKITYHITPEGKKAMDDVCIDFTRTFFGIFNDFVCHKCVGTKKEMP